MDKEFIEDSNSFIFKIENNKIRYEHLETNNLTNIISTLKKIKEITDDSILFACCYKQYEGSFNVEVDPKSQYERIYNYACNNYKTFARKSRVRWFFG